MQKLAWFYAFLFFSVVAIGYIPGFTDDQGLLLGLFKIDLIDDGLHLGSALWAACAAWTSRRAAVLYFKGFGTLYSLDAVVGLLTGSGYLDLGIFLHGSVALDLGTRIAINFPHVVIGGGALVIGFFLSRKFA